MQLPRIKSSSNLSLSAGRRAARRASDSSVGLHTQAAEAPVVPRSLPVSPRLRTGVLGSIPMQVPLPPARLSPTHPACIRDNAMALTASFLNAPAALDRDPKNYKSPLSGHLQAYQSLNARLLQRVSMEPRIAGFGHWLHEMCAARIKSPDAQRPAAENLARRLFELVEALYLCAETPTDCRIDVGCDQAKRSDAEGRMLRSSDIAVINDKNQTVRHVEVTSLGAAVHSANDLCRPIKHVVDKVSSSDGGTYEGAIAYNWADDCLPEDVLGEVLLRLNSPEHEPWKRAAQKLDRLVFLRYDPEHADPMAIFTKVKGQWYAETGPFMRLSDVLPEDIAQASFAPGPSSTAEVDAIADAMADLGKSKRKKHHA